MKKLQGRIRKSAAWILSLALVLQPCITSTAAGAGSHENYVEASSQEVTEAESVIQETVETEEILETEQTEETKEQQEENTTEENTMEESVSEEETETGESESIVETESTEEYDTEEETETQELVDATNFVNNDALTEDFTITDGVLTAYNGTAEEVVIPDTVTTIAANVFKNNTTIKKVTFSSAVREIGSDAFAYCTSLVEVALNEGLETIGEAAFRGVAFGEKQSNGGYSHGTLTIPSTVQSIGYRAFYGCTYLEKVEFLNGETEVLTLENIWENAETFAGCENLEEVILPERLKSILGGHLVLVKNWKQ